MKKLILTAVFFLLAVTLSGCGKKDDELEQYKADMEEFAGKINELGTAIDNIDTNSDTCVEEMLGYLDEMDSAFAAMGDLPVPQQFANVEELADDASSNLSKSVSLYHQAFDNPENYDPQLVEAALEYYNRALKRLDYIGTILQGSLPEDESITIVHEDDESGPAPDTPQEDNTESEAGNDTAPESGNQPDAGEETVPEEEEP